MGLYSDWNGHAVNSKLIIGRVGEQFDELDKDELRVLGFQYLWNGACCLALSDRFCDYQ